MADVFREGTSSANMEVIFKHPSTTIMLTEAGSTNVTNGWFQHFCPRHGPGTSGVDANGVFRIVGTWSTTTWPVHGEGCNVAWIDGHVEAKTIRSLADPGVNYWDRD
jgi:prepilin-type processing-associated H-X9-DG protein